MDYYDNIFNEAFESVYMDLLLKKTKGKIDKKEIQEILKYLYIKQDNNWSGGVGNLKEAKNNATIAAYETIISDW